MKAKSTIARFLRVTGGACGVLALATAAYADTYAWFSGTVGGEWTTPANWNSVSYPDAAGDIAVFNFDANGGYAIAIASNVTVGEIQQPGSWERGRYVSSFSGDGSLTFDNGGAEAIYDGSYRQGHYAFTMNVPIVLNSDLTFMDRARQDWNFQKEISGPGRLTLLLGVEVPDNNTTYYFNLNVANSYLDGTVIGSRIANPWNTEIGATVRANADGALGAGDVELITHSTQLGSVGKLAITSSGGAEDRIADTASLFLNYDPIGGYTPVTLDAGVDETVAALYFAGVQQASGTWGHTGSLDQFGNPPVHIDDHYFFGEGVLRVTPAATSTTTTTAPTTTTVTVTTSTTTTVEPSDADYQTWDGVGDPIPGADWKIDSDELGWVIEYWLGAGDYYVEPLSPTGYAPGIGSQAGDPNNADFQTWNGGDPLPGADWVIDNDEVGWVIEYWLGTGDYHVEPLSPTGYAPGP